MAIPNVSGALTGWIEPREIRLVTKSIVNHLITQISKNVIMKINVQPMPPARVMRKPEEQRTWRWHVILAKGSDIVFSIDDQIHIDGTRYRIQSIQDWSVAGYRRYDAYEDFTGSDPEEESI